MSATPESDVLSCDDVRMSVVAPELEAELVAAVVQSRQEAGVLKDEATAVVSSAVAAALEAGVSRATLADALGITVARVYQLRDGR
jgi:hypothetical protein